MPAERDRPEMLARVDGVLGELALRRRSRGGSNDDVYELIVNGVFLMDTAETSTEELLARVALDRHPAPRRILVGGLGLGLTVATLLADARVERVDVVEIEPALAGWLRDGLVPAAGPLLADPRVHIEIADVREVLRRYATTGPADATYDAVLLDVDNGPGFLVHETNAALYEYDALSQSAAALRAGGLVAIWSAAPSEQLAAELTRVFGAYDEVSADIKRDGRVLTYHLYLATIDGPSRVD